MKVPSSTRRLGVAVSLFLLALASALMPQQEAHAQKRRAVGTSVPAVPQKRHPMAGGVRFVPGDIAVRSIKGVAGFKQQASGKALVGGVNGVNVAEKVVDITQQATPDEITPFWTSDERFLYYASNQDPNKPSSIGTGKYGLFRISAAAPAVVTSVSTPQAITPSDSTYDYKFPAIDASGGRIAFIRSSDGGAHWNLYVSDIPATGTIDTTVGGATNLRSITLDPTNGTERSFIGQSFVTVGRPSWIGQSDVVFAAKVGTDTNYHLYSVNINADANGNYTFTQITGGNGDENNPAVSPDGKEIAFDSNASGFATGSPRTELLPGNIPTSATGTAAKRNIFALLLANPFNGAANYSVVQLTNAYAGATPTNSVEPAWSSLQNNPTINPNGSILYLAFATTRQAQFDPTDTTNTVITGYKEGTTYDIYSLLVANAANNAQYPLLPENAISGNNTPAMNSARRLDVGDDTSGSNAYKYNDEYPTWSPFQSAQRMGFQSDRTGTYQEGGFGVGFTSTAPAHDLFIATVIDTTAPTLLRFDTSSATGEIVHINPVTDTTNPYNPNVSVRTRDQGILPGSTLFFTVRVDDREAGMRPNKAVFLQFKNPNSKYQSQAQGGLGVEHKEFQDGAYTIMESSNGGYIPLLYQTLPNGINVGNEFDAQAIGMDLTTYYDHAGDSRGANQVLYTPGQDDSLAFAGGTHPPLDGTNGKPNVWLELKPLTQTDSNGNTVPVLPKDGQGGILYGASWKIPDEASDWYIDVILYDNAVNPFSTTDQSNFIIYDNVWGFSSALPPSPGPVDILVVSDYALGQKFFGSRFNTGGGSNLGDPVFYGSESYFTDIDVAKFPAPGSTAPSAPGSTTARFWDPAGPFYVTPQTNIGRTGFQRGIPNVLGVKSYVDEDLANGSAIVDNEYLAPTSRYTIWRILSRGPVPASLLQSYLPQTVTAPADIEAGETAPRTKLVYNRMVIWNSPLAGDLFVGAGTITDLQTQNDLSNYVKQGGRLFISGQDIAYALEGSGQTNDFFANTLNAQFTQDDADAELVTSAGDPTLTTITHDAWTRAQHVYSGNFDGTFYNYEAADAFQPLITAGTINPLGTAGNNRGDGALTAAFPSGRNDAVSPINAGKIAYNYSGGTGGGAMISSTNGNGRVLYSSFGFESLSQDWFTYSRNNTAFVATRGTRSKIMHNITCSFRTGVITGRIIDTNGSPVANVLVRAVGTAAAAEGTALTDAGGNYTIQGVTPDAYAIFAYKRGYFTQHTTGSAVHGGYQIQVNLVLTPAAPGALGGVSNSTTGSKGGVFASDGVTPIGGITVEVLGTDPTDATKQVVIATTKSANDGSYGFPSLPVDLDIGYEVIANPAGPNFVAGYNTVILKAPPQTDSRVGPNTTVLPGKDANGNPDPSLPGRLLIQSNVTAQVDFLLPAQAQNLNGHVYGQDDASGTNKAPLAGATVQVFASNDTSFATPLATLTTDSNGAYTTTTALTAGQYVVRATKAGYDTQTQTVTVGGPNPTTVPDIVLTKQAPGSIVGKVLNVDSSLYAGAKLTLYDNTTQSPVSFTGLTNPVTSTTTSPNNYEFDNVPPGTYYIVVSAPGYVVTPNPSSTFTVVTKTQLTGPTFQLKALAAYGSGVQLVATPNDYSALDPRTLFGFTAGSTDFANFKIAVWDAAGQNFPTPSASTPLQPGSGYFVYFNNQAQVTTTGQQRVQNGDPNTYSLNLATGWNLIGNPFGNLTADSSVEPDSIDLSTAGQAGFTYTINGTSRNGATLAQAVADGAVQSQAYGYSGSNQGGQYLATTVLKPWYGYWFRAFVPVTVTLHYTNGSTRSTKPVQRALTATTTTSTSTGPVTRRSITSKSVSDWRIQIAAQQGDLMDTDNSVGVSQGVRDGFDSRFDNLKPPAVTTVPSLYLAIQGTGVDGKSVAAFSDSIQPNTSGTKSWEFTIQSPAGQTVTVFWPNISRLPRELEPVLVDEATNKRVMMRSGASSFQYQPTGGSTVTHRFRLEVGRAASRPLAFSNVTVSRVTGGDGRAVGTSYRFRFTTTQEADVTAEIQTLSGRSVRSIQTRALAQQGSDIIWDGRDSSGNGLPVGAYMLNLTARDASTGAVVRYRVPVVTVR